MCTVILDVLSSVPRNGVVAQPQFSATRRTQSKFWNVTLISLVQGSPHSLTTGDVYLNIHIIANTQNLVHIQGLVIPSIILIFARHYQKIKMYFEHHVCRCEDNSQSVTIGHASLTSLLLRIYH